MWDLDHTLLATMGVGTDIYAEVFQQVTGVPYRHRVSPMGTTELGLLRAALDANGLVHVDAREIGPRFFQLQALGYWARSEELLRRGHALPGAREALDELAGIDGVCQTVVTGNTPQTSRAKLEIYGLADHVELAIGAYGTESEDRAELVKLAVERACRHVGEFEHLVVVGDTPSDIRAGMAAGVATVGVASGANSVDELRDAGANEVLASLEDSRTIRVIVGPV